MTPFAELMREDRRICLLRALGCMPERRANHLVLHEALDSLGHGVGVDVLLADLTWLADLGLVACDCLESRRPRLHGGDTHPRAAWMWPWAAAR